MLQVHPIPAFNDNYIWCISTADDDNSAVIVDPGCADAALAYLEENELTLQAILVTHHHHDHVGGVAKLVEHYNCPVIGYEHAQYKGITLALADNQEFELLSTRFKVMTVPGHTLDHIAFYSPADVEHALPWLFCGDTLFSGGCGRLFEGTPAQMWHSLKRLRGLPANTLVFCAHEYTMANIKFAQYILPSDHELARYREKCESLRAAQQPTLPSNLATERKINIFLRADEAALADTLKIPEMRPEQRAEATFASLRQAKDRF